jgi:hypothetical protein
MYFNEAKVPRVRQLVNKKITAEQVAGLEKKI